MVSVLLLSFNDIEIVVGWFSVAPLVEGWRCRDWTKVSASLMMRDLELGDRVVLVATTVVGWW